MISRSFLIICTFLLHNRSATGNIGNLFVTTGTHQGECAAQGDCEPVLVKRGLYLKKCAEINCSSFSRRVGTKEFSLTRNVSRLEPGHWEIFVEHGLQSKFYVYYYYYQK